MIQSRNSTSNEVDSSSTKQGIYRYPGVHSFGVEKVYESLFFGRDAEKEDLFQMIRFESLAVLFGKSGLGKTSLLQAGVFPMLRAANFLPLRVRLNQPDIDSNEIFVEEIHSEFERERALDPLISMQSGESGTWWEFIKTSTFSRGESPLKPVLILDQFEEIFTLHNSQSRKEIAEQLSYLVNGLVPPEVISRMRSGECDYTEQLPEVHVVLSMRIEHVGQLQDLFPQIPAILKNRFNLQPMNRIQAEEAIIEPALSSAANFRTKPFSYNPDTLELLLNFLSDKDSDTVEPYQLQVQCHHIERRVEELQRTRSCEEVNAKILQNEDNLKDVVINYYLETIKEFVSYASGRKSSFSHLILRSAYSLRRRVRKLCEYGLLSAQGSRLPLSEEHIMADYGLSLFDLDFLVDRRLLRREVKLSTHTYELAHDSLVEPILSHRYSRLHEFRILRYSFGLLCTLLVAWLQLSPFPLVERLEWLIYDQRMAIMPKPAQTPAETNNRIVIIDMDERSLQAEGQYPWPRLKMGRLIEGLRDYGALVVGFDLTFPEPDRSIRDLLEPINLTELDPVFVETLAQIEPQIDSDQYFANAMRTGIDVVLGTNFNASSEIRYQELPTSIVDIDPELAARISVNEMAGYTGNIALLQNEAIGTGAINQSPDIDGIVRRMPFVIRFGSELYPTLALEMVRVYNFAESYELVTQQLGNIDVVTAVRIGRGAGAFEIPTDELGQVLIPYLGPSSLGNNRFFLYISATDILSNTLNEEERNALQNSLVLVGTSAPGLMDIRSSPLERFYPGVEIHATMLNALLNVGGAIVEVSGDDGATQSMFADFSFNDEAIFPYKPFWEVGALVAVSLALGLVMTLVFVLMSPLFLFGAGVLLISVVVWVNFYLWSVYLLDISLILLLLLVILITVVNLVFGFAEDVMLQEKKKLIKKVDRV